MEKQDCDRSNSWWGRKKLGKLLIAMRLITGGKKKKREGGVKRLI